jgi:hypothetical protein
VASGRATVAWPPGSPGIDLLRRDPQSVTTESSLDSCAARTARCSDWASQDLGRLRMKGDNSGSFAATLSR